MTDEQSRRETRNQKQARDARARGGAAGYLSSNDDHAGLGKAFARYPAVRVSGQMGVQDCVRNLVTELVRMTFRNGFGGK